MAQGGYLETKKSPTALTVVILMHGAAIGALALSKMDVISVRPKPIDIIDIKTPPPPPEVPPEPVQKVQPQLREVVTLPPRIVETVPRPMDIDTSPVDYPPQPYVLPGKTDIAGPPSPPPPPPPPPPEVKKVEPARAKANLGSYISDSDYPAAALRNEDQGSTRFRLTVGPDGRVQDCAVTGSSGSSALDTATCRIMKSRARFTPARDNTGRATNDTVSSTIRWVLPE
ncbi:MAG TPA: TonB family protein [Allosphingosinicella sp.]|jgi:protein TonB